MWVTPRPLSAYARVMTLVIALLACGPAWATEADMEQLPVSEPFLCLLCHEDQEPQPTSFALNDFGVDFLANARRWDAVLAAVDSDGDGCLNGVELGDANGDGQADGNVERLQTNPGESDCGSNVDRETWGNLKALFDNR